METRIAQGLPAFEERPAPSPETTSSEIATLMKDCKEILANRNAGDDKSRIDRHLLPRFGALPIDKVTLPVVMRWLDQLRKTTLSGQSRRHF